MNGCCGCCSALRPRYKRLVDNIFPAYPQDGLVKANMQKLTFYSLSSPEKLDRIGEYLYQKASRDIYRKRYGFVIIAVEAMDQLLVACHAHTLNLFVESFLKIVQKLLESTEPELQILATQSFVKFANIEEDTPSYHRRYDFFVSKFSSMCHSNGDEKTKNNIRIAGIKGLQAVVRKTVSDELVENIWEPVHMDKIVPSLLFNMQDSHIHTNESKIDTGPEDQVDPPMLAETCMRELVGRASFGHIRAVLRPVLQHFDNHELWVPNQFAIHTFRIIMFSIQAQYSYTIVETLMTHLDKAKSSPSIRTSIAGVLAKIIAIAAGESVGPTVLETINSLLSHLRDSVKNTTQTEEKQYQEALINGLGEFANHLPDYQKIEIMMFIMSKIPFPSVDTQAPSGDNLLQSILLKSLLKVGTKYQTIHLHTTFPVSFLEPLLRMSLAPDPDMRLLVQKIFHTLIDRHHNMDKLSKPTINVQDMDLMVEKSSRPDLIFINKHGPTIYDALYTSLQLENNTAENIEAIYTTLALFCVELANNETIVDLLQLLFGIQNLALTATLTNAQKFHLHVLVISLLMLIPLVVNIPNLEDYASQIVEARRQEAPHLLPELMVHYPANSEVAGKVPHLLIDQMAVCDCLKEANIDSTRLAQSNPYDSGGLGVVSGTHRHSWMESARGSIAELSAQEVDSAASSPGLSRKFPSDELTFESMKKVLTENSEIKKEAEAEKRKQLNHTFRTAPFAELMRKTQPKQETLQNKLNDIFKTLSIHENRSLSSLKEKVQEIPSYEQNFPDLFSH